MTFLAMDQTGHPFDPHTSIFPIMKEVEQGRSFLVGTGFFITRLGHFVTAKHVIMDAFDEKTHKQVAFLHAVHFVQGSEILVRHITKVSLSNDSDVAVGKMDFHKLNDTGQPLLNKVPIFTLEAPTANSNVVTYAYPESSREFGGEELGTFVANYYAGQFIEHCDHARDAVMVTWPHYATSIKSKGGASGGPVFDSNGRVFGINSVGGIIEYAARVAELLPLEVPEFPGFSGQDGRQWPTVSELAKASMIVFDPPFSP